MKDKAKIEVMHFLRDLEHPLKSEIELLREIILGANNQLKEHIKWNAPSYCYNEEDCITFNFPPKKDCILLVFHQGSKVKDLPPANLIQDKSGLLEWKSTNRAIIRFFTEKDIRDHKEQLEKIIQHWIAASYSKKD